MEWTMPVNDLLPQEITKLDHTLIPPGTQGPMRNLRVMQESLSKVIDQLGEQSAKAQGLSKVITSGEKLHHAPTHILYLLKDALGKGGKGEVIGLLKVGRKHLFLFDGSERVREVEPMCVLDFFVIGDRQRHGHGRRLFDHMLEDLKIEPHLLAIDGPSAKMEHFLMKNYNFGPLIRQNNNFAISKAFFTGSDEDFRYRSVPVAQILDNKARRTRLAADIRCEPTTPASAAIGRFAALKPQSSIGSVIHGGEGDSSAYQRASSNSASAPLEPEPEEETWLYGDEDEVDENEARGIPPPIAWGPVDEDWEKDPNPEDWANPPPEVVARHRLIYGPTREEREQAKREQEEQAARDQAGQAALAVEVHRSPERPRSLPVGPEAAAPAAAPEAAGASAAGAAGTSAAGAAGVSSAAAAAPSPAGSTVSRRDSQLTDKGYFDVKFYHNKLW